MFTFLKQIWRRPYETVQVHSDSDESVEVSEQTQCIIIQTDLIRTHIRQIKFDILRLFEFPEKYARANRIWKERQEDEDVYTVIDMMMLTASIDNRPATPTEQKYNKKERSIEPFFNWLERRERTKKHTPEKIIQELETLLPTQTLDKELLLRIQHNLQEELELFQRRFHLLLRYPRLYMKKKIVELRIKDAYYHQFVEEAFANMRALSKVYQKYFLHEYCNFTAVEKRILQHSEMTLLLKMKAFHILYPTFQPKNTNEYGRRFQYYFSDQYICVDYTDEYEVPISNYIFSEDSYVLLRV